VREAEIGMLVVETIAKILRAYFVQKKPIKEIFRDLHVSRKVVRSEATESLSSRDAAASQDRPLAGASGRAFVAE
jgi:hypothetical protein